MNTERLAADLAGLYSGFGYDPYTMSKFEEYELYLRNKDFLISDRVLTFTDTDGKLMALKPDVTLSIIKNTNDCDDGVQKVFYRENVYRPDNQGFREIMQLGLECMGDVDDYCILEVLLLAVKSLRAVGRRCVLDVSHMGLLSKLLQKCGLRDDTGRQILDAIGSKNVHEIRRICQSVDAPWEELVQIADLSGSIAQVLSVLESVFSNDPEVVRFKRILSAAEQAGADCINVDFSVVNDMNYYNGIVFRGFVEGIPDGVLSGGQYDGLMRKMKRTDNAIGFALYPDLLKRLSVSEDLQKVDTVVLYDDTSDLCRVAATVEQLASQGLRVCTQKFSQRKCAARQVYKVTGNEVTCVEADA